MVRHMPSYMVVLRLECPKLTCQSNEVADIIVDESPAPVEVGEPPNVHDR